jgi:PIN domain nuclease of toxin-antitoxin system
LRHRLLLDTNVALLAMAAPDRLSSRARSAIEKGTCLLSTIT